MWRGIMNTLYACFVLLETMIIHLFEVDISYMVVVVVVVPIAG